MKQETAESIASYSIGGGAAAVVNLADIAETAQQLTIILACLVVVIRLIHDGIRLYRYLRYK